MKAINEDTVVVSGVSTKGAIDFTRGLVDAEPQTFVDYLEANKLLPDLSNIDRVVWYGFGDVADAQEVVPANALANMREIYKAYLAAAGVREVIFDEAVGAVAERTQGLPTVTVVDMPDVPAFDGVGTTVKLTQASLSFENGTAIFVDDDAAGAVLAEFAQGFSQIRRCASL